MINHHLEHNGDHSIPIYWEDPITKTFHMETKSIRDNMLYRMTQFAMHSSYGTSKECLGEKLVKQLELGDAEAIDWLKRNVDNPYVKVMIGKHRIAKYLGNS